MGYHESNSTRVAQPPGGRSSFVFADGSDARRMPEPRLGQQQPSSTHCVQPPGGRTSFIFDDSMSRGVGNGDADRRHTNGLRRLDYQVAPAAEYRQPPGGRSSFVLDDNSSGQYNGGRAAPEDYRQPPGGRSGFDLTDGSQPPPPPHQHQMQPQPGPQHDSLSNFVRDHSRQPSAPHSQPPPPAPPPPPPYHHQPHQQPPYHHQAAYQPQQQQPFAPPAPYQPQLGLNSADPLGGGMRRAQMAPPGGHSSFSLGWGGDNSVNHHKSYQAKVHGMGRGGHVITHDGLVPRDAGASGYGGGGHDATMAAKPSSFTPWQGAVEGGGLHGGRSSSRVSAPPGGHSSISFG